MAAVTAARVVRKKLMALSNEDPDTLVCLAQHEVGVALQNMSLDLLDSLDKRMNILGDKVSKLERTTRKVVAARDAHARAREAEAKFTAEQERAEKSLLSMWLQGFVHRLSSLDGTQMADLGLDVVDFAFCRYALNIALSSSRVSQEKIISSRIPNVRVSMIDGANNAMVPQLLPQFLNC